MKDRRQFFRHAAFVLFAWLLLPTLRAATSPDASSPLLLISLDAFRWDYCALYPEQTPRLRQLAREGISARQLIPAFPTNTFPNHYTIVTGLYPSHHGIVNNEFFDPQLGEFFRYNVPASAQKNQWWGGEPIWVTAQRQGLRSACAFWIASEAEIRGVRPNFWRAYTTAMTFEARLQEMLGWMTLPPAERPNLITFYLEQGNSIGHKYGPESPELIAAVKSLDDQVGAILDGLRAKNISPNVVVVSDHGITPISLERVILLDDFVARKDVQLDFDGPVAGLRSTDGNVARLVDAFAGLRHAKAYRTADLPARFHVTENPRNPDVWIVPEEGWEIYFREKFEAGRDKFNRAEHGYDNALESMRGILIASGPAFRRGGTTIEPVENIHVYNALCAVLGIKPASNDGDDRLVRALLAR